MAVLSFRIKRLKRWSLAPLKHRPMARSLVHSLLFQSLSACSKIPSRCRKKGTTSTTLSSNTGQ